MPLDAGVAVVRVVANSAALSGSIASGVDTGVTKAQSRLAAAGSKITSVLTSPLFLAGAAITAVAVKTVNAASDQVEAMNKVKVVFDQSAGVIEEFAKTSAEGFGVSETAALQAAGQFGQLLQAANLTEAASATMSVKLVQLAADLASFNNIDPGEALTKLSAGLAGQARPLREVGVFLSAARVEAEAYKSGIAEVGAELTDAQKIQARYNLILEDTAKAQGDFARTLSSSLPNRLRVLRASFEDIAVEVGTALLPAVEGLVAGLQDLLPIVVKLIPGIIKLGEAWLAWKALTFIPKLLGGIAVGLEAIAYALGSEALLGFAAFLEGLGAVSIRAAAGTAVVAYAIGSVGAAAQTSKTELRDLNEAAQTYFNGLEAGTLGQAELNAFITGNVAALHGNAEAFRLAATQGISYEDALWGIVPATEELNKHWRAVSQTTLPDVSDAVGRLTKHLNKAKDASKEFAQNAIGQFDLLAGGLVNVDKNFALTANALVRNTGIVAQKQRTLANDLKKLDDLKIGRQLKNELISLGPDVVDAFIKASPKQRAAVTENLRAILDAQKKTNREIKKAAHDGFVEVGLAMADGAVEGIIQGSPDLTAAARKAVRDAIDAAKAEAGIASASKEFKKIGLQMMEGLVIGMEKGSRELIRTATKIVDILRDAVADDKGELKEAMKKGVGVAAAEAALAMSKAQLVIARGWEKAANDSKRALDKIVEHFHDFKNDIRSGFAELQDLAGAIGGLFGQTDESGNPIAVTGGDIASAIAKQVADAQALAALLQQAAGAGLSKDLLAQFAQQGAAAIPELQALLANPELIAALNDAAATIAQAAGQTADALGDKFFAKAIQHAANKLDRLSDAIERFVGRVNQMLSNAGSSGGAWTGASVGGGGGGGGTPYPATVPYIPGKGPQWPTVTVNMPNYLGSREEVASAVRNELLKIGRNNGGTGL